MEWVKSTIGYYRLLEIATGTDAMEIMFKRADALAGEIEQGGFIPDAMIPQLTRRPAQAKKTADALVKTGLWARVRGGYQILDWPEINAELVILTERRKRDRNRKRAVRAAERSSEDMSADASSDGPAPRPADSLLDHKKEIKKKTAAAAAGAAAAAALPGTVAILADKLRAHTPLRGLRFDTLTDEQMTRLDDLIHLHGDEPLVSSAIATCRNPAPTYVTAFLGTWDALPPPGTPLHLVRAKYCDIHNTRLSPAGVCSSCASEKKAADQ